MLIVLFSILFFGGDDGPSWPVDEVIANIRVLEIGVDRSEAAIDGAESTDNALRAFAKQYDDSVPNLGEVHRRHDASMDDYQTVMNDLAAPGST